LHLAANNPEEMSSWIQALQNAMTVKQESAVEQIVETVDPFSFIRATNELDKLLEDETSIQEQTPKIIIENDTTNVETKTEKVLESEDIKNNSFDQNIIGSSPSQDAVSKDKIQNDTVPEKNPKQTQNELRHMTISSPNEVVSKEDNEKLSRSVSIGPRQPVWKHKARTQTVAHQMDELFHKTEKKLYKMVFGSQEIEDQENVANDCSEDYVHVLQKVQLLTNASPQLIKQGRVFVKYGPMSIAQPPVSKNFKLRFLFLFSDLLVISQRTTKDNTSEQFSLESGILLKSARLILCSDNSAAQNSFSNII